MKTYIGFMKSRIFHLLPLASVVFSLGACGFFSDKKSETNNPSSSASSSSGEHSSSSGDPDRLEISYSDTVTLDDTLFYQVADSIAETAPWNFYLGEFPQGALIHLGLKNVRLSSGAQFRVLSEKGQIQLPTNALPEGAYSDYAVVGDSSFLLNHFVIMDSGYYYLEVDASRMDISSSSQSDFQAYFTVDSNYFSFVGKKDSVELPSNSNFEGCFRIDQIEDSASFYFEAGSGQNLSLITKGQSINGISLREIGGETLDSATSSIRVQMLPQDSTRWQVNVRTTLPSYYAGNYAFFTLGLTSIQLGKGEYFAFPDTMPRPGDTLTYHREGSENSGWDVRHDHYIYLGSLTGGDTVILWHGSDGIERVSKLLRILDSKGSPVDTLPLIHSTNWTKLQGNPFVPSKTGEYYLHFTGYGSKDTYWKDENYTLHLRAMIQKLHTLTEFNYNPSSIQFTTGDTLDLSELLEFVKISPSSESQNFLALLARSERNVLLDSIDILFSGSASGDEVRSGWLLAGEAGTAHLLLKSTADPSWVDTCVVQVVDP